MAIWRLEVWERTNDTPRLGGRIGLQLGGRIGTVVE